MRAEALQAPARKGNAASFSRPIKACCSSMKSATWRSDLQATLLRVLRVFRDHPDRRNALHSDRRARRRRDQLQSAGHGAEGHLPPRPLLSAQWRPTVAASAARASRSPSTHYASLRQERQSLGLEEEKEPSDDVWRVFFKHLGRAIFARRGTLSVRCWRLREDGKSTSTICPGISCRR